MERATQKRVDVRIRVPLRLRRQLVAMARQQQRSINGQVCYLIEHAAARGSRK